MKLGEALSLRARQAQQLDDLRGRIRANVLVQEDEPPAEDPNALIADFESLSDQHAALVQKIAMTNSNTMVDGERLLSLLHQREALRRRRNMHELAAAAATPSRDRYRYTASEIKFRPAIDVQHHRASAEELDARVRALDARIQAVNWETDLYEEPAATSTPEG